jgi:hypothetical protein
LFSADSSNSGTPLTLVNRTYSKRGEIAATQGEKRREVDGKAASDEVATIARPAQRVTSPT